MDWASNSHSLYKRPFPLLMGVDLGTCIFELSIYPPHPHSCACDNTALHRLLARVDIQGARRDMGFPPLPWSLGNPTQSNPMKRCRRSLQGGCLEDEHQQISAMVHLQTFFPKFFRLLWPVGSQLCLLHPPNPHPNLLPFFYFRCPASVFMPHQQVTNRMFPLV